MATERRSHRQVLVAFSAIMLATLLAALDQTIVATALPRIVADLHGFTRPVLGGDGVPADHDGHRAAVRQAERPLRAPADVRDLDLDLPARLGAVRDGADDGRADRVPGAAGRRRRRAHPARPGRGGGPVLAARARALPGLHRLDVGDRRGRRPAARRDADRRRLVALDLLHQHPAGRAGAGRGRQDDEDPAPPARAHDRLRRRGRADRRRDRHPAGLRVGRDDVRLELGAGDPGGRDRRRGGGRLLRHRAARQGAAAAAGDVPDEDVRGLQPRRSGHRRRPVRDHDLRARVHAGRARRVGHELRASC